jgi:hypothetical protein
MKMNPGLLGAVVGCLMVQGCIAHGPIGEVRVSELSTAMSGEVAVMYKQLFSRGFECCAERSLRRIISAAGEVEHEPLKSPLLAADCSNSPAQSGLCIPFVVQNENDRTTSTYALPDGTRIVWNDSSDRPYALSRIAGSETMWTRESTFPADAVREKTLLVIRNSKIAEKLDIYTGEPLWSIEPPDEL